MEENFREYRVAMKGHISIPNLKFTLRRKWTAQSFLRETKAVCRSGQGNTTSKMRSFSQNVQRVDGQGLI